MEVMGMSAPGMYLLPGRRLSTSVSETQKKRSVIQEPVVVDEEQDQFVAGLPYHLIGVTDNTGVVNRHKHSLSNASSASKASTASNESSATFGTVSSVGSSAMDESESGVADSRSSTYSSEQSPLSLSAPGSSSASLAEDASPSWPLTPNVESDPDESGSALDRALMVRSPSRRFSTASSGYRRFSASTTSLISMSELSLCEPPLNIVKTSSSHFPARSSSLRNYSRPSSRASTLSSECSPAPSRALSSRKTMSSITPLVPLYEERPVPRSPPPRRRPERPEPISEVLRDYELEASNPSPPARPPRPERGLDLCVKAIYRKELHTFQKRGQAERVSDIDISGRGTTIAAKQGKNVLHFWNADQDSLHFSIKIPDLHHASSRHTKPAPLHSHVLLSDRARLVAISTRVGQTVEIWDWARKKRLQRIEQADRWVAARFEALDEGWSPLAAFSGRDNTIDLYAATDRPRKPFAKVRTIHVAKAGLPRLLDNPMLALSRSQNLLVAATGPRPPMVGRPPPERETLLVAWDVSDYRDVSSAPHRFVCPWQYRGLDTATPCCLETHGSLVVSVWTPSDQRAYRHLHYDERDRDGDWRLVSVDVPTRHVVVWNLAHNGTRTYEIPNTTCRVSPDCRFVAYSLDEGGSRSLVLLDALTGHKVWSLVDEFPTARGVARQALELAFSSDGRLLIVADAEGHTKVYDIIEMVL